MGCQLLFVIFVIHPRGGPKFVVEQFPNYILKYGQIWPILHVEVAYLIEKWENEPIV